MLLFVLSCLVLISAYKALAAVTSITQIGMAIGHRYSMGQFFPHCSRLASNCTDPRCPRLSWGSLLLQLWGWPCWEHSFPSFIFQRPKGAWNYVAGVPIITHFCLCPSPHTPFHYLEAISCICEEWAACGGVI